MTSLRTHRLMRTLHVWIGAWGAVAAVLFGVSGFIQNHRGVLKLPQGSSTEVSKIEVQVPEEARASPDAMKAWLANTQHLELEQQRRNQGPPGRGDDSAGRRTEGSGMESAAAGRTEGGGPHESAEGARKGAARAEGGGSGREDHGKSRDNIRAEGGESQGESRGETRGGESRGDGRAPSRWVFTGGNARVTTQAEYSPGADTVSIRKTEQSPLAIISRLHKGVGGGIAWIILSDSFAVGMVLLGVSGLVMWSRGRTPKQMVFSILGVATVVLVLIGGSAIL